MKIFIGKLGTKALKDFLSDRFEIINVPSLPVQAPVRQHVDLQLFKSNSGYYVCEPSVYDFYKNHIEFLICGQTKVSFKYPADIAYNAFEVCDTLICKENSTDIKVKDLSSKIINVSQGYAKCSTVTVNENAVITSDTGIRDACQKAGAEVLFVRNDTVRLEGYGTGFIGGASAVTDKEIIFTGDAALHPDFTEIKNFIESFGKKVSIIKGCPLYDYGSPVIID